MRLILSTLSPKLPGLLPVTALMTLLAPSLYIVLTTLFTQAQPLRCLDPNPTLLILEVDTWNFAVRSMSVHETRVRSCVPEFQTTRVTKRATFSSKGAELI